MNLENAIDALKKDLAAAPSIAMQALAKHHSVLGYAECLRACITILEEVLQGQTKQAALDTVELVSNIMEGQQEVTK